MGTPSVGLGGLWSHPDDRLVPDSRRGKRHAHGRRPTHRRRGPMVIIGEIAEQSLTPSRRAGYETEHPFVVLGQKVWSWWSSAHRPLSRWKNRRRRIQDCSVLDR